MADYVGAPRSELNEVFNLGNKEAESQFYTLETVHSVLEMLTAYRFERVESMLQREFGRLISPLRMKYVTALLRFRVEALRRILGETRAS